MWMNKALYYGADILLSVFAVYLLIYYFDIFFARRRDKWLFRVGLAVFALWQLLILSPINFLAYINIAITIIVTLFVVMVAYEGVWWNKCVFVIAFNTIWMLMETLCSYILMIYCEKYAFVQPVGSLISKVFFFMIIVALKKVFTDDKIKELPVRYSIMLVLIPTGSIYIMDNVFMLGFTVNNNQTRFNSTITVIILLGMNILIFYIYMKLADDLSLRRMTVIYEKQLELYEQHQKEREITTLQMRDEKHNMKNNLISILAYAEEQEYGKMVGFIHEIMDEGGLNRAVIANSGNIVVDSQLGYWCVAAREQGIDCSLDISIPMTMPFKGADICLILGNLLENAVEASQKVEGERYIKIRMKYDKGNLLIFVKNSYQGELVRTKDKGLKSTKQDTGNHGVGLPSVRRAAAKYNGTVVIDDTVTRRFLIRVVLYGKKE